MKNLWGCVVVSVMCVVLAGGCKKKPADTAATGSGSAMGSADMGSAMAGSGSAMGPADMGSAMAGSGSAAMAGSGSATGSAAGSGSAAAAGSAAPAAIAADAEGARTWDCKKTCKLAVSCKAGAKYKGAKECEDDCTHLAADKDGRYARGSIEGAAYYTCLDKTKDCAGIKKCDDAVPH